MTPIDWPVHTQRLSLCAYSPEDLDAVWEFEQLPQVQQWLGWAPHSREQLRDAMDAKSSSITHVMVLLSSTIIGHIMITPRDSWAQTDVAACQGTSGCPCGRTVHLPVCGQLISLLAVG